MWEIDDALEGALTVGESRGKGRDEKVMLEITRRDLFELQQLLRELVMNSPNFFLKRKAVLSGETLRKSVFCVGEGGLSPEGKGGE
jgi:hypothetical protein